MAVNEVIWIIFVSFHVICFLLLIPSYIYIIWETKSDYFGIDKHFTGLNEKDMASIERYIQIYIDKYGLNIPKNCRVVNKPPDKQEIIHKV